MESLRDSLKRCPEGTFEAAVKFRTTGDMTQVPLIVMGIVERYIEPDQKELLSKDNSDELDLVDDLGIDSLTMMEIVILVEESTDISFQNEELRDLKTLGDVKTFMTKKIQGD
jgi:3-hydroxyacyl-[acyl-carrier-protein] dehydratase